MKCGPDDCPIKAFSDLTPAEQRVERKRTAKKMSDQGFTIEQIAKQLNVSKSTISTDLQTFPELEKSKINQGLAARIPVAPRAGGAPLPSAYISPEQDCAEPVGFPMGASPLRIR